MVFLANNLFQKRSFLRYIVSPFFLGAILVGIFCAKKDSSSSPATQGGEKIEKHTTVFQDHSLPSKENTKSPSQVAENKHSIFDFIDNRLLSHIEKNNGLLLLANSPGFLKYLPFARPSSLRGWHFPATTNGKTLALAKSQAHLQIPWFLNKGEEQPSLWIKLQVKESGSLSIRSSGKIGPGVSIKPGWQVVRATFPSGTKFSNEKDFVLEFSKTSPWAISETPENVSASAAIEWIYVGYEEPKIDEHFALMKDHKMMISSDSTLHYYVALPKDAALSFSGKGKNCKLDVLVDGGSFQKQISISTLENALISVSELIGKENTENSVFRLGMRATSTGGVCDQIEIEHANIVLPKEGPTLKQGPAPKNVIFWLSDDTRADKFHLWNQKSRVKTPVLDSFSEKSTRFHVAYAQGNESRVSHASIFTGQYPAKHNFIDDKAILGSQLVTIPETFRKAGIYTVGHTANGYLAERWGFGEGWNLLHNHIREPGGLKAEDLVNELEQFLKKQEGKNKPFFYFLGSIDAHTSWRPHEPWLSEYDPNPYSGPLKRGFLDPQLDQYVAGNLTLSQRDKVHAIALYDSDISYTDKEFGDMLDLLKKTGHMEDTMIVFTSDHGEEFWDHGKIGHGQSLHPELIHVPLWIYYPPLFPEGKSVEEGVELIDIFPTLTDAFQLETPKDVQGSSLIPLSQGIHSGYPRPAISSHYELAHTMRLGSYKLRVNGAGNVELFDAVSDTLEQDNLADKKPSALRFLGDPMRFFLMYQRQWNKSQFGTCNNQTTTFVDLMESGFKR